MAIYVYWFVLALVLLGLEMATGTFYLLVLSIALAAGGLAALSGAGVATQLSLCALAGVVGIFWLRRWKAAHGRSTIDQNLDIGQPVKVLSWQDTGARVYFRGAEWDAELDPGESGQDGPFYIKSMRGSVLVLTRNKPA